MHIIRRVRISVKIPSMTMETDPDFIFNLHLSNWIYDVLKRANEDTSGESQKQNFAYTMLAKIHRLTIAFQESNHLIARAMLTRALIECVADIFTVYHAPDQEMAAHSYITDSYRSYAKLHRAY